MDRSVGSSSRHLFNERPWQLESVNTGKHVASLSANQRAMKHKQGVCEVLSQGDQCGPAVGHQEIETGKLRMVLWVCLWQCCPGAPGTRWGRRPVWGGVARVDSLALFGSHSQDLLDATAAVFPPSWEKAAQRQRKPLGLDSQGPELHELRWQGTQDTPPRSSLAGGCMTPPPVPHCGGR